MTLYNRYDDQYRRLCGYARTFADIADTSIFRRITEQTTPEQFELALQNLKALCERPEAQVDLFHYGQAYGSSHSCICDIYTDAEFRLKNLTIMHQKADEPAPKHQLITSEGAVIDLEERAKTSNEETYLGTDDTAPTNGDPG